MEQEPQPALPDLEMEQMVKEMPLHERAELKARCLEKISDYEAIVRIVNDINEAEGFVTDLELL